MQTGRTALAWAAHEGDKQIVHILLNAGANPDIQDEVAYSHRYTLELKHCFANFHRQE